MTPPGSPDLPASQRWGKPIWDTATPLTDIKPAEYDVTGRFSNDRRTTGDNSSDQENPNHCDDDDELLKLCKSLNLHSRTNTLLATPESCDLGVPVVDLLHDCKFRGRTIERAAPSALKRTSSYKDRRRPRQGTNLS